MSSSQGSIICPSILNSNANGVYLLLGHRTAQTAVSLSVTQDHLYNINATQYNAIRCDTTSLQSVTSLYKYMQNVDMIRGCSHITSAKIRGSWTPPPPSVSNGQHLAYPSSAFISPTLLLYYNLLRRLVYMITWRIFRPTHPLVSNCHHLVYPPTVPQN